MLARRYIRHAAALAVLTAAPAAPASSEQALPPDERQPQTTVCDLIETAADAHGLPVGFFTRLIWKESRFRDDAVSPKGAQGIAQFMPGTAAERGLLDPFDPVTAIPASANLLADLDRRFGNLGLAAAAYNAGANRVSAWLNGGTLPWETQDYVLSITGTSADDWAAATAAPEGGAPALDDCVTLSAQLRAPGNALVTTVETASAPWGVQVAGNFSKARAVAAYEAMQKRYPSLLADRMPMMVGGRMQGRGPRAFYRVRVPVETRAAAEALCRDLKAAGGSCIVLKT